MKIVIFTLPINVNNKSHDFVAHFPRIQHVCLRNEIRCHCDSTALPRRLIRRTGFKMCKLNGNDLRIPRT